MTAYELVMAYHHAWTSGDLDTAMGYLAEDFVCHAPSGEITGREAYRASLGDFAARLTGIQEIAQLSDPDHRLQPQTGSQFVDFIQDCPGVLRALAVDVRWENGGPL